jgi:hypothetical protein
MVHAIDHDSAGNLVVGGFVTSPARIGRAEIAARSGVRTAYVVSVTSSGDLRWQRLFGGDASVHLTAMQRVPGAVIVAGTRHGAVELGGHHGTMPAPPQSPNPDCWIASLDDSDGSLRWVRTCGTSRLGFLRALAIDGEGNVYVTGELGGSGSFGGDRTISGPDEGSSLYVASYTRDGALRWVIAADRGTGRPTQLKGLVVAGGTLWFAGVVDGETILGGQVLGAGGRSAAVLGAIDAATGAMRWVRTYPGSGEAEIVGLAVDRERLAITGFFNGTVELVDGDPWTSRPKVREGFIATVDRDTGSVRRAWRIESAEGAYGFGIQLYRGHLVVAGSYNGSATIDGHTVTATGMTEIFVLDLDPDAGVRAVLTTHGTGSTGARVLRYENDGTIVVAGRFTHDLALGDVTLRASGEADGYVAELRPLAASTR